MHLSRLIDDPLLRLGLGLCQFYIAGLEVLPISCSLIENAVYFLNNHLFTDPALNALRQLE